MRLRGHVRSLNVDIQILRVDELAEWEDHEPDSVLRPWFLVDRGWSRVRTSS